MLALSTAGQWGPAFATGLALILGSVLPALMDYIPLPVKWSQPIKFDPSGVVIGVDRLSDHTANIIRADDFICLDPKPIVAVRWWGLMVVPEPGMAVWLGAGSLVLFQVWRRRSRFA